MKKSIKIMLAGVLAVPMMALGISAAAPLQYASADTLTILDGANAAKGTSQADSLFDTNGVFNKIINAALFLIGAISVLMLIYGGVSYTISMGDAKKVETAKNTIMYAVIGIVVALLAYAIVTFVLSRLIS